MSATVTRLQVATCHSPGNAAIAERLRALADAIDRPDAEPIGNVVTVVVNQPGELTTHICGSPLTNAYLVGILAFAQQKAMLA